MKKGFLLIIFISLFCSCQHKPFKAQALPVATPPDSNTCDTINVTYKKDIQPVIQATCYTCHATSVTVNGGLDLENFTSLKTYLQYGFRGDGIYGSKFYHCISHSLLALPMPPNYKLDTCTLKKIKGWISLGAMDN